MGIALGGIAAVVVLIASGARSTPTSEPLLAVNAERVVVVGVPHLGLEDLRNLPTLGRLAHEGAAAAMTVRTRSAHPSVAEGYASLGAGDRVQVRLPHLDEADPVDAPLEGATAGDVVARRTGRAPSGNIVVPAIAALLDGAGQDLNSLPGALGDALRRAGLRTAVISNADEADLGGRPEPHRPAALAVVDRLGSIGGGVVDGDHVVVPDRTEPFGQRADADAVLTALVTALDTAAVVVVDPGDTTRAVSYRDVSTPEAAEAARTRALQRLDDLVARIVATVDERTLVLIAGVTPPTTTWQLTPLVAVGAGVSPGTLHSLSTKRAGLVTLTDLGPTILDALDAPIPDGMIGSPLRHRSTPVDLQALERTDELAGSREAIYYPMALTYIVVQAGVYLIVAVLLVHGRSNRWSPALRLAVLTFASWPLATFVERAIPSIERVGTAREALTWAIAAAVAVVALRARRHPLAPLSLVCAATVALLVADVATGARLQVSSVLGYSPHTAARYTGLGNTAFAVLAASTVVVAAAHVHYAQDRSQAWLRAVCLFTIVLVADVWPTLGADVGGILTLVPVFGLMLVALTGRRVSWRAVLLAGALTVLVLAAITVVDITVGRGETHLGRFASSIGGDGTFGTTLHRKWSTNARLLGRTIWTWMVPITIAFMIAVLVIARGWRRLLPTGSPLRAGVVGTLLTGLVGWLVNDSGVVVAALVFIYIGPYLTLLSLETTSASPNQSLDPAADADDLGPGARRRDRSAAAATG